MAAKYQAPRGTYDLLPGRAALRREILAEARALLQGAGFGQIDTPVFEDSDLFVRTVGEATDIVRKEMYTFEDRGGRSLTLRPEGTAPVCRAYLEHGMHKQPQPVKLWYTGPMFRYEAPQSGRYRQHSQIGAETIGSDDPAVDAELIDLLAHLYARLGLPSVRLHLTSIGDPATRAEYGRELREFLLGHDVFDEDQRARIEINPMRAFDWSAPEIVAVTEDAPKMIERLSDADALHFDEVRSLLDAAAIDYELDPRLVRGLDYYTRTVFEFRSESLGAQSGIGGGGRYDRLIEQLGGPATPGMGWATGLERIEQVLADVRGEGAEEAAAQQDTPQFMFIVTEPDARPRVFRAMSELREEGIGATMGLGSRSLKNQMRAAERLAVPWVVIVGPQEWERSAAAVRDMTRREQDEIPLSSLRKELLSRGR
ncbi:MAG TPA: histidine--tRNA ligase [Solirubrobacterales bacterium]|nr:histidine--tRNA ligase [Solirubrobacterales bacterium]